MEKGVALVTGAASGLGRTIALALKEDGFFVFGTSRQADPTVAWDFPLIRLDVRSDDSVRSALGHIRSFAGRLDVLVNNAGFRFLGAAEDTTVDEAKAVFETNFFGAHRVTVAALPLLRASGRASKIINVTSLSGLNALPFGSVYSASKWAFEGYSESLRHEVKSLGISVSIVEPGAIRSEKREPPHRPKEAVPAYETARQHALEVIVRGDRTGIDTARVADCVIRIVHRRSPKLRYRVGPDATWLPRLKWLPWSWYERGIRWRYGLDA